MEFRNKNLFTFFTLKRNGHHAVIVWLAYHFNLPIVLLNNITPYTDPYLNYRFPNNWDRDSDWLVSMDNIEQIRKMEKHCLMLSIQDFNLTNLADGRDFIWERQKNLGESLRCFNILVLRDPFNMLASRLYKPGPTPKLIENSEILDYWETYAEEYLGLTNFLQHKLVVNYNLWFLSIDYRKQLSASFGLSFTDAGLNIVPKSAGGGSSFDKNYYDGRGNEMKVLERWKICQEEKRFYEAFRGRSKLADLYRKIFPYNADIELFLQKIGI